MITLDAPFVLLDDARETGAAPARLYRRPVDTISCHDPSEVEAALDRLRVAIRDGLQAAGYLTFEAGNALAPRAVGDKNPTGALLWFGLFEDHKRIAPEDLPGRLPDPAGAWSWPPAAIIERTDYDAAFAQVIELIRAGDIYQANLTFRLTLPFLGDPLSLYARLRERSRAGWSAVVHDGHDTILSCSPELFFAIDGGRITTRPMKGTARRGETPVEDARAAGRLAGDAKERAENLMIVDLMRNDLAQVARPGSVAVPELYRVESYPTVHQMVSTITADLAEGRDAVDVLRALFPCGSITGAPKQRAREIIAQVEPSPRGIYTGAIGRIDQAGAMFNVAIRTLVIQGGDEHATMGVGGGIVADSTADAEFDEALAKAAFADPPARGFDLIETMAFEPLDGIALLHHHLARMRASAKALGFAFDRHDARNELQAATFRLREPARLRLVLARSGAVAIEVSPMPPPMTSAMAVAVVALPVARADIRLRHKTSDRHFYDEARARAGTAEVLFEADGQLTEGSFTSLFVERDGRLLTPPLAAGLLPGVLRAALIERGRAVEAPLTRLDLTGGFLLGNALRGLMPAQLAVAEPAVR
ncbi:aminodeoxychorismate synthase component I [uncultured Sphingomonas sp.]|uniref:aminodeoxychorismate synthase component I n=1 Tax=uncultured Sphingomonas sp. TaxID=158754 RepID=UPI0035C970A7